MKIVVAPDKFKGSLPAIVVAAAIAGGLRAARPDAELVTVPVATAATGQWTRPSRPGSSGCR